MKTLFFNIIFNVQYQAENLKVVKCNSLNVFRVIITTYLSLETALLYLYIISKLIDAIDSELSHCFSIRYGMGQGIIYI